MGDLRICSATEADHVYVRNPDLQEIFQKLI
jgi:hypothetical protein